MVLSRLDILRQALRLNTQFSPFNAKKSRGADHPERRRRRFQVGPTFTCPISSFCLLILGELRQDGSPVLQVSQEAGRLASSLGTAAHAEASISVRSPTATCKSDCTLLKDSIATEYYTFWKYSFIQSRQSLIDANPLPSTTVPISPSL